MAQYTWLSERCHRLQHACFILNQTPEQRANHEAEAIIRPELERYTRYQAHHDRCYQRASKELLDRKKQREKAERGFVSQKQLEAKEARATEMHIQRLATAQAKENWDAELHTYKLVSFKAKLPGSNGHPKPQIPVTEPAEITQTAA